MNTRSENIFQSRAWKKEYSAHVEYAVILALSFSLKSVSFRPTDICQMKQAAGLVSQPKGTSEIFRFDICPNSHQRGGQNFHITMTS